MTNKPLNIIKELCQEYLEDEKKYKGKGCITPGCNCGGGFRSSVDFTDKKKGLYIRVSIQRTPFGDNATDF